jgi:hypothetical protein
MSALDAMQKPADLQASIQTLPGLGQGKGSAGLDPSASAASAFVRSASFSTAPSTSNIGMRSGAHWAKYAMSVHHNGRGRVGPPLRAHVRMGIAVAFSVDMIDELHELDA